MQYLYIKKYLNTAIIFFDRFVKVLFLYIATIITEDTPSKLVIFAVSSTLLGASLLSIGNEANYLKNLHLSAIKISTVCIYRILAIPFVIFYIFLLNGLSNIFFIAIGITLYAFEIFELEAKEKNNTLLLFLKSTIFIIPLGLYCFSKNQIILIITHSISNIVYIIYYFKDIINVKKYHLKRFLSIIDYKLVIISVIALSLGRVELLFGDKFTDDQLAKIYYLNRIAEIFNFILAFILYINFKNIFVYLSKNIVIFRNIFALFLFSIFIFLINIESITYAISISYFCYLLLGGFLSYLWVSCEKTNYALFGTIAWAIIIYIFYMLKLTNELIFIKWIYFIPMFFSLIGVIKIKGSD